jgi:hypothetical protein
LVFFFVRARDPVVVQCSGRRRHAHTATFPVYAALCWTPPSSCGGSRALCVRSRAAGRRVVPGEGRAPSERTPVSRFERNAKKNQQRRARARTTNERAHAAVSTHRDDAGAPSLGRVGRAGPVAGGAVAASAGRRRSPGMERGDDRDRNERRDERTRATCVCARHSPARGRAGASTNDPSAGSPTETLLRLLLPLNGRVRSSSRSRDDARPEGPRHARPVRRPHCGRSIGSSDGRCVQRAGT